MTNELKAAFADRRAAELAVEHLVQEIGLDRKSISIAAHGDANTSGTRRSGADAQGSLPETGPSSEPKLSGEIEMSVACASADAEQITEALKQAGGRVSS